MNLDKAKRLAEFIKGARCLINQTEKEKPLGFITYRINGGRAYTLKELKKVLDFNKKLLDNILRGK